MCSGGASWGVTSRGSCGGGSRGGSCGDGSRGGSCGGGSRGDSCGGGSQGGGCGGGRINDDRSSCEQKELKFIKHLRKELKFIKHLRKNLKPVSEHNAYKLAQYFKTHMNKIAMTLTSSKEKKECCSVTN